MTPSANYPVVNLFHSEAWSDRINAVEMGLPRFYTKSFRGLKVSYLNEGLLSDFETWPCDDIVARSGERTDWIVVRKLLGEQASDDEVERLRRKFPIHKRPVILPYSSSPFIDLTKPMNPQKDKIAHVYRCERKLTREIGKPELREHHTASERAQWLERFTTFQSAQGRLPDQQNEALKKWVLSGEKPEWMKLFCLMVGEISLAAGLFYYWNGVFYYYSSAMNPDPIYRKYGPGKMMVEKLIQYSIAQGGEIFDFLQGDHCYKSHWNPETRMLFQWIGPVTCKGSVALQFLRLKNKLRNPLSMSRTKARLQQRIEQECAV